MLGRTECRALTCELLSYLNRVWKMCCEVRIFGSCMSLSMNIVACSEPLPWARSKTCCFHGFFTIDPKKWYEFCSAPACWNCSRAPGNIPQGGQSNAMNCRSSVTTCLACVMLSCDWLWPCFYRTMTQTWWWYVTPCLCIESKRQVPSRIGELLWHEAPGNNHHSKWCKHHVGPRGSCCDYDGSGNHESNKYHLLQNC